MTKNFRLIILLCFLASIAFFAFYEKSNPTPAQGAPTQVIQIKKEQNTKALNQIVKNSVVVEVGGFKIEKEITSNKTVYELLKDLESEGMHLKLVKYPALGYYIQEIGELKEGGGKYIIYYVNGKSAEVGISTYKLKAGDKVEFKLEESLL